MSETKNPYLNGPESQEVYDQAISLSKDRLKPNRENRREVAIVRAWQRDNRFHDTLAGLFEVPTLETGNGTKISTYQGGDTRVHTPLGEVTQRDRIVAETVVQYMMSNCGLSICREALEAVGYTINYPLRD